MIASEENKEKTQTINEISWRMQAIIAENAQLSLKDEFDELEFCIFLFLFCSNSQKIQGHQNEPEV